MVSIIASSGRIILMANYQTKVDAHLISYRNAASHRETPPYHDHRHWLILMPQSSSCIINNDALFSTMKADLLSVAQSFRSAADLRLICLDLYTKIEVNEYIRSAPISLGHGGNNYEYTEYSRQNSSCRRGRRDKLLLWQATMSEAQ